ncbi:2988_t:CDS:1, partial [Gigaspora rosea]
PVTNWVGAEWKTFPKFGRSPPCNEVDLDFDNLQDKYKNRF